MTKMFETLNTKSLHPLFLSGKKVRTLVAAALKIGIKTPAHLTASSSERLSNILTHAPTMFVDKTAGFEACVLLFLPLFEVSGC
jgi:hypothetical protein